ncbi:TPA: hypothetical protein DD617_02560 [Candidatus Uhrbacteria bacterium]|nr:hypothetical protein [Candidatus Uhrbacteria bacterium]
MKNIHVFAFLTVLFVTVHAGNTLAQTPSVDDEPKLRVVRISSIIYFEAGKASLTTSGANTLLNDVAPILREYPEMKTLVRGSASADGGDIINLNLSGQRAATVARFLENHGIPATQLEVVGTGENNAGLGPEYRTVKFYIDGGYYITQNGAQPPACEDPGARNGPFCVVHITKEGDVTVNKNKTVNIYPTRNGSDQGDGSGHLTGSAGEDEASSDQPGGDQPSSSGSNSQKTKPRIKVSFNWLEAAAVTAGTSTLILLTEQGYRDQVREIPNGHQLVAPKAGWKQWSLAIGGGLAAGIVIGIEFGHKGGAR